MGLGDEVNVTWSILKVMRKVEQFCQNSKICILALTPLNQEKTNNRGMHANTRALTYTNTRILSHSRSYTNRIEKLSSLTKARTSATLGMNQSDSTKPTVMYCYYVT